VNIFVKLVGLSASEKFNMNKVGYVLWFFTNRDLHLLQSVLITDKDTGVWC